MVIIKPGSKLREPIRQYFEGRHLDTYNGGGGCHVRSFFLFKQERQVPQSAVRRKISLERLGATVLEPRIVKTSPDAAGIAQNRAQETNEARPERNANDRRE
jgi:hypothetical protein